MTNFALSLKEFKCYYNASYNPVMTFSKPSGSSVRISSTTTSMGQGIAFVSIDKQLVHGNKVSLTWSTTAGTASLGYYAYIIDGEYDKGDDLADFLPGSGSTNRIWPAAHYKGTGMLQTIEIHTGTRASTTDVITADLSTSSLPKVTIAIYLLDGTSSYASYFDISALQILNPLDDSVLCSADLSSSLIIEQTSSLFYYDWAFIGSVDWFLKPDNYLLNRSRSRMEMQGVSLGGSWSRNLW